MLQQDDEGKRVDGGRSRSFSASSGLLLSQRGAHDNRQSAGLESSVGGGHSASGSVGGGTPYTPTTPGGPATSVVSGPAAGSSRVRTRASSGAGATAGGIVAAAGARNGEAADPFFRPPRPRRVTMDLQAAPEGHSRGSWASGDWTKVSSPERGDSPDLIEGPSVSGRATPSPAYINRDRSDSAADRDSPKPKPDYATREVDYYYGVRGPALSHVPTRRLRTGPADPTGPVSSATGWFRGLFGGKTKDKAKGFEVVRSSRAPPQVSARALRGASDGGEGEVVALEDHRPYRDEPDTGVISTVREGPRKLELDDEGDALGGDTRHQPTPSNGAATRSTLAPTLPDIDAGSSIHMPSRLTSRASSNPSREPTQREALRGADAAADIPVVGEENEDYFVPAVPRRSSKRTSSHGSDSPARLSVIPASPLGTPRHTPSVSVATVSSPAGPNWPLGPGTLTPPHQSTASLGTPASGTSARMPFGGTGGPSSTLDPERAARYHPAHNRSYSGTSVVSSVSGISAAPSAGSDAGPGRPPSPLSPRASMAAAPTSSPTATSRGGIADASFVARPLEPPPKRHGASAAGERPSSVGYVPQHRASDGIHVVREGEGGIQGAVAEWVDEERISPGRAE